MRVGITLIALVITIIVLLILAGVSIAMLTGENGILTQANKSKIEQSHGAVREGISLAYNEYQIEINTASNEKIASTEVVQIQANEEKALATTSTTFLQFLSSKGYIKEGTTDVLNVEALTGSKQALGNGEDKDIYKIEEESGKYIVNYYDEKGTPEQIWNISSSTSTETGEVTLEPDTGKEALILVYNVNAGDTIELPYYLTWIDGENEKPATFNFTVDWGDGYTDTITNTDIESKAIHEYITAGEKKITITGTFESISYYNNETADNIQGYDKLTRVEQWGTTGLKAIDLGDCTNLTQIAQPTESSFKDLSYVYFSNSGIQSIPDKMFLNCLKITSFVDAFAECNNLQTIGDYAFAGCNSVTSFERAFEFCSKLQTIGDYAFAGCNSVTSFEDTFDNYANLQTIGDYAFAGCNSVTSFERAFDDCDNLQTIGDYAFAGCDSVTSFERAFEFCSKLQTIGDYAFAGCNSVISFKRALGNCIMLQTIGNNIFENCANVTDFSGTFANTEITNIPENLFSTCTKVEDFTNTFAECENLTGVAPELWLRVPNGEENEYRGIPDGSGCFGECENLTNYEQIPAYWRTIIPN